MKVYVLIHGNTLSGYDPSLSGKGYSQIMKVKNDLLGKITGLQMVVIGTGQRHDETRNVLLPDLDKIALRHCPFCGTGDLTQDDDVIVMANTNRVGRDEYIGMKDFRHFAWQFVGSLKPNTLLIADVDFLEALGLKGEKGCLYEVNTEIFKINQIK